MLLSNGKPRKNENDNLLEVFRGNLKEQRFHLQSLLSSASDVQSGDVKIPWNFRVDEGLISGYGQGTRKACKDQQAEALHEGEAGQEEVEASQEGRFLDVTFFRGSSVVERRTVNALVARSTRAPGAKENHVHEKEP